MEIAEDRGDLLGGAGAQPIDAADRVPPGTEPVDRRDVGEDALFCRWRGEAIGGDDFAADDRDAKSA